MHEAERVEQMFSQSSGRAVEGLAVWADANQRILREMAELAAATAKESVRLYGEMQHGMLEAVRDAQAAALRWQSAWQDVARDPAAWYQRTLTETADGTQKAVRLVEGNAQALSRCAERLQTSTEQAGRSIQDAMTTAAAKLKDVYAG